MKRIISVGGEQINICHVDRIGFAYDREGNAYQEQNGAWKLVRKAQKSIFCVGKNPGKQPLPVRVRRVLSK